MTKVAACTAYPVGACGWNAFNVLGDLIIQADQNMRGSRLGHFERATFDDPNYGATASDGNYQFDLSAYCGTYLSDGAAYEVVIQLSLEPKGPNGEFYLQALISGPVYGRGAAWELVKKLFANTHAKVAT